MKTIAFIGIDGSGKTTQASRLKKKLSRSKKVKYNHLFAVNSTSTGKIFSKSLLTPFKYWVENRTHKSKKDAYLKFIVIYINLFIVSWTSLALNKLSSYDYIIYDRYYYDRVINNLLPFITYFSNRQALFSIYATILLPRPDYLIMLKISSQESWRRKKEHTLLEGQRLCILYSFLSFYKRILIIDATEPIDVIHDKILSKIEA